MTETNVIERARENVPFFEARHKVHVGRLTPLADNFVTKHLGKTYTGIELDTLIRYATKGKFYREGFAIEAYGGTGGRKLDEFLNALLALTMLQSASLMQDDVYDQSKKRHGGDTMHVVYRDLFIKESNGNGNQGASKYGEKQAILVSQEVALTGIDAINDSNFAEELKNKGKDLWKTGYQNLIAGERKDIKIAAMGDVSQSTIQDWYNLVHDKTKPLFKGAVDFGLTFSRSYDNPEIIKHFDTFSESYAFALQGTDDLLGIFGEPAVTGKSNTDDITSGALNILTLLAYNLATPNQKRILNQAVGQGTGKSKEEMEQNCQTVREVINQSGALDELKRLLEKHTREAIKSLYKIPNFDVESRNYLEGAAVATMERKH